VSGELSGFVAGVDRLLTRGHGLFPASGGTGGVGIREDGPALPVPPAGGGQLGAGAAAASDDYRQAQAAVSSLSADTGEAVGDANAVGAQGRARSGSIRDIARTQAAAIGPVTDQPAGVKLMVSTMDQRLSDMQRQIDATEAENQLLTTRLRQVAAAYRGIGAPVGGGRFPMSGLGGMPGGGSGLGSLASLASAPGSLMSSFRPAGRAGVGSAGGVPAANVNGFGPNSYGLPIGTDIRQGGAGFPAWVYALGKRFGLEPSTYAGHQEVGGANRGIDWWPQGAPDMSGRSYSPEQVARLDAFAKYLRSVDGQFNPQGQVIWWNPITGEKVGFGDGQAVGPGTSQPNYYNNDWKDHSGHVHTRFMQSVPPPV